MGDFDLLGGVISGGANIIGNYMQGEANRQSQLDFAQHGLSWKVADAKAAGINPLAALGAQTSSFSNTVGAGTGIADAGQDISRAMHAMQDPETRQAAALKTKLDLERSGLQNDVLRMQLAHSLRNVSQPGTGPGVQFGPKDPYPALYTSYRGPNGKLVQVLNEKAASGFQGEGLFGTTRAAVGALDTGSGVSGTGVTPFSDWKRWMFPNGSALFGP